MIYFDNHTHCEFSPDGRMKMSEAVSTAQAKGLSGICFSDHFDLDSPHQGEAFTFDPKLQQSKIDYNISNSNHSISILKGIELGLQPKCLDQIKEFTQKYNFDSIIASVHYIDGLDPYNGEFYQGLTKKQSYSRYLETIYECISNFDNFDILGHFDYIARYSPYNQHSLEYSDFPDHLDEILRILIDKGKILEINTNTYRERNGRTTKLDLNILKRYKELGGEALSLGSDAHEKERIGDNFRQTTEIIQSIGINYLCHFKNRKIRHDKIKF